MGGTLRTREVTIRGFGRATLRMADSEHVTIDCRCRLLPGRPYLVQGFPSDGESRRLRVVAASVHSLSGEGGVGYRVVLQADAEAR
jgi:hypothetical protein